jgi:2-polyprenyl-3-methyl-5-hydroxy-6-metoxy-1,4-benzoquinol methylase
MKVKEKQNNIQFENYKKNQIKMGPYISHIWLDDPKHLVFLTSRYKFVSKLLVDLDNVIEIGCGDMFGSPIVSDIVKKLHCIDFEDNLLPYNTEKLKYFKNISFEIADITNYSTNIKYNAAFCLDLLEHIPKEKEGKFFKNVCNLLYEEGIMIIGIPNKNSSKYATKLSKIGHINLKTPSELKSLMKKYFKHVFMFSMNDEIVHTGYSEMAHYLFVIGIDKRK